MGILRPVRLIPKITHHAKRSSGFMICILLHLGGGLGEDSKYVTYHSFFFFQSLASELS